MILKRIEPGKYRSDDGRALIERVVSRQTRRADEICWSVMIDGRMLVLHFDTKREAVDGALRAMK